MEPRLDLDAYLRRIRCAEPPRPDLATLRLLHRAHLDAIPFENLDVQMGIPVRLDLASLQEKLVRRRRGGYCHEHNTLFAHVLGVVGFEVIRCEARVRQSLATGLRPRTHMVLTVPCEGHGWLVDVGFGGDGAIEPVPLDGEISEQFGWSYRVVREDDRRVLQWLTGGRWEDVYAVEPDAVYPVDMEVATWFTSTHPSSPFVNTLTAQRTTTGGRHVLRNLTYTFTRGGEVTTRTLARSELVPLLRDVFQLDVPAGAFFRAIDGVPATSEGSVG